MNSFIGKTERGSCLEWLQNGYNKSDVYGIITDSRDAYCDMTTDGGGWLVLLRRKDGTVDFYQRRNEYRVGFGDLRGEFWFGLASMHRFTKDVNHELRVDLEDWEGNTAYAKYSTFKVKMNTEEFRLTVGGYSGTAGDSFSSANGMNFTTKDADNDDNPDENCATRTKAGWWFKNCFQALLTGPYSHTSQGGGIVWKDWKDFGYSLKSCEMKIRPVGNA